jgi:hypothetical protein
MLKNLKTKWDKLDKKQKQLIIIATPMVARFIVKKVKNRKKSKTSNHGMEHRIEDEKY